MKNIHILPTDKPSFGKYLVINKEGKLCIWNTNTMGTQKTLVTQHIYITSDEYIGLSYYLDGNLVRKGVIDDKDYWEVRKDYKKIILTTDPDLIKDGVQAIDDEFIEWFIKNPSCERVEVIPLRKSSGWYDEKEVWHWDFLAYKIIIPKKEPKQEVKCLYDTPKSCENSECRVLNKCNGDKVSIKQETLELKRSYQKHSLTKTKGYKLWCNIIQRCYNPKNHSYKYYGEKGVVMEDYFKSSYENFIDWIKGIANYNNWLNSSELSLDRIDNTLGYVRGNLKFSTKTEQVENQNLRVDNKCGYKGVCYHKLNKKYGATITINKLKVFLGYYDTALEAALIYDNYILKNNINRKTNLWTQN